MRITPPQLAIHAGAHHMGARSFHRFLGANQRQLATRRIGVCASGPDATLPWPAPGADIPAISAAAQGLSQAISPAAIPLAETMILSDPDLLGSSEDLLAGRFYPGVGARATALRLALGRPADRIVLSIMSYDQLFRAAWRAKAAEGEAAAFGALAKRMAGFSGGWIDVIDALAEVAGQGEIVLLTAPPEPADLLAQLCPGLDLEGFDTVTPVEEPTESAVAMIQRHIAAGGRFAPGQTERLIAFHARQPQDDGVVPDSFPALSLADLRGRYVADLATLAARPGVTLAGYSMAGFARPVRRFAT